MIAVAFKPEQGSKKNGQVGIKGLHATSLGIDEFENGLHKVLMNHTADLPHPQGRVAQEKTC